MFFLRDRLFEIEFYKGEIEEFQGFNRINLRHKNKIGKITRISILLLYVVLPLLMVLVSVREKSIIDLKSDYF